jgi:hypothetical protein
MDGIRHPQEWGNEERFFRWAACGYGGQDDQANNVGGKRYESAGKQIGFGLD